MAHLLTIKTFDRTKVTWCLVRIQIISIFIIILFFLIELIRLDWADSCSWDRTLLVSDILSALLFLRFFYGLGLLLESQCFRLLEFGPRLFRPMIFHGSTLRIAFLIGLVTTLATLIYVLYEQSRLEICFGLGINHFLNYFCLTVYLLALLFYTNFYQWFENFAEESNQI